MRRPKASWGFTAADLRRPRTRPFGRLVARVGVALLAALCATLLITPFPARSAVAGPWDQASRTYPADYDLRAQGRVSAVSKQDNYSTCWVHAAMGSIESCLLPGTALDLSENHLANFQASRLQYEGRAPSAISIAYVARWEGPVLDSSDRYPRPGGSPEGLRAVRHVQEVLVLPPRSGPLDNAAIKWAVLEHGAVDAAMAYETSGFNARTNAYYSSGTELDHHVCIVGWDDAFPAESFRQQPPGPGAFLIKNSWGIEFGQRGYFWISYHDRMLGRELAVFSGAEGVANYDAIYQHDALGCSRSIGFGEQTAWFAARYTSGGDGRVTAVSFYTPGPDASYEVRVAGSLDKVSTTTIAARGTIAVGGYHTIRLITPVSVATGADFVVAVRLTTPGSNSPIPVEHPTSLIAPRAAVGRSFISRNGSAWIDLRKRSGFGRSDVCLKAFVTSRGSRDNAAPRARLESTAVSLGRPTRIHFRLADPAFSCGSAVVKLWLRDTRGRTLRSIRIPAVMVNERELWRFTAPRQRGTYRLLARAWDVAGHRQVRVSSALLKVR